MLREKVTKLAKIMFTGLTMALCVTALNPAVTAKAEDMLQESEPNDNPATANQIPLNTWVRGEVGYQKEDWYYMMQSVEHYVSGIRAQGLQEQLAGYLENII